MWEQAKPHSWLKYIKRNVCVRVCVCLKRGILIRMYRLVVFRAHEMIVSPNTIHLFISMCMLIVWVGSHTNKRTQTKYGRNRKCEWVTIKLSSSRIYRTEMNIGIIQTEFIADLTMSIHIKQATNMRHVFALIMYIKCRPQFLWTVWNPT